MLFKIKFRFFNFCIKNHNIFNKKFNIGDFIENNKILIKNDQNFLYKKILEYWINNNNIEKINQYNINLLINDNIQKDISWDFCNLIIEMIKNNYLNKENVLKILDFIKEVDKNIYYDNQLFIIKFVYNYEKSYIYDENIFNEFIKIIDKKLLLKNYSNQNELMMCFYLSSFKIENKKLNRAIKKLLKDIKNRFNGLNCHQFIKIIQAYKEDINKSEVDFQFIETYIKENISQINFNYICLCFFYSSNFYYFNFFNKEFYDVLLEEIEIRLELEKDIVYDENLFKSINLVFNGFMNIETYKSELFRKINDILSKSIKDLKTFNILKYLKNQKRLFLSLFNKIDDKKRNIKVIKQNLKNFNNDFLKLVTDCLLERKKYLKDDEILVWFESISKTYCKNKFVINNAELIFMDHKFQNKEILGKINNCFDYIFIKKNQKERISNYYSDKIKLIN